MYIGAVLAPSSLNVSFLSLAVSFVPPRFSPWPLFSNMSPVALSALIAIAAAAKGALAQDPTSSAIVPLASKHFSYPDGIVTILPFLLFCSPLTSALPQPYQADTDIGLRGGQSGYNLCNSTTEGTSSMCQTAFINHLDDWCVWAPPTPGSTIGDTEHEEVAWCTKKGRGTRLIPGGALTGVQLIKTPGYIQVVGFIDQTKINIKDGDTGGELDPHGADFVSSLSCCLFSVVCSYFAHSVATHSVVLSTRTASPPTEARTIRSSR